MTWPANEPRDDKLTEDEAEAHVHGICFEDRAAAAGRCRTRVAGPRRPRSRAPRPGGAHLPGRCRSHRPGRPPLPRRAAHREHAHHGTRWPAGTKLRPRRQPRRVRDGRPPRDDHPRETVRRPGLARQGYGYDPLRPPRRVLELPRYTAMEEFFDRSGPWGREMMCNTASVQVCLDAGRDTAATGGYRWRWRLAHQVGPVLVAAFANSSLRQGAVRLEVHPPGGLGPPRPGAHPVPAHRR